MLAKLGFVVVVLIFGGLMFVAGTLAPDSVRTPVAAFGHKAVAKLPMVGDEPKAVAAGAPATPAGGGSHWPELAVLFKMRQMRT